MSLSSFLVQMANRVRTLQGASLSQSTVGPDHEARTHKTVRWLGVLILAQRYPLWGPCDAKHSDSIYHQGSILQSGSLCHETSTSCSPPLGHLVHQKINWAQTAFRVLEESKETILVGVLVHFQSGPWRSEGTMCLLMKQESSLGGTAEESRA